MRPPRRKVFGFTWLYLLNFLFLQWFCFRLAYTHYPALERTVWSILRWPLPLTGWWSPYRYIGGKKRGALP